MQKEKDLLYKKILPELTTYAKLFGEEVQFIDLEDEVELSNVSIENSKTYFLSSINTI